MSDFPSSPETETVAEELAAIRKALEDIADGYGKHYHGKHYHGKFPRDNAWAALDRVDRLEAALTSALAQTPAVTDEMIIACVKAQDGYGVEKGSHLWDVTKRGLEAALSISSTDRPDPTRLHPTTCYCRTEAERSHCAYEKGGECTRGLSVSSPEGNRQ